jgi:5-(hydroxymethyl)furfural/furfural oxidase
VRDCADEAYLLPRDPPLRLINGLGLGGAIKGLAATAVLASPALLRRALVERMIRPGRLVVDQNGSKPLDPHEILAASGTMFHPSCSCAMGREDDDDAVVDPKCRVYGVRGLRIADASIMPKIPSANTNFPTIMIAERMADFIRSGARAP